MDDVQAAQALSPDAVHTQAALSKLAGAWNDLVHVGGSEQALTIIEAVGEKTFGKAFTTEIGKCSNAGGPS